MIQNDLLAQALSNRPRQQSIFRPPPPLRKNDPPHNKPLIIDEIVSPHKLKKVEWRVHQEEVENPVTVNVFEEITAHKKLQPVNWRVTKEEVDKELKESEITGKRRTSITSVTVDDLNHAKLHAVNERELVDEVNLTPSVYQELIHPPKLRSVSIRIENEELKNERRQSINHNITETFKEGVKLREVDSVLKEDLKARRKSLKPEMITEIISKPKLKKGVSFAQELILCLPKQDNIYTSLAKAIALYHVANFGNDEEDREDHDFKDEWE